MLYRIWPALYYIWNCK